jgi:hypothetical protein
MNTLIVSEREREDPREYYRGGKGGDADDESYSDETSEGGQVVDRRRERERQR